MLEYCVDGDVLSLGRMIYVHRAAKTKARNETNEYK